MGIALCKNGHLIHAGGFYEKPWECKDCIRERSAKWYRENKEVAKKWAQDNSARLNARKAERRKENPSIREREREWKAKNIEKIRAQKLAYYHAKGKFNEKSKEVARTNGKAWAKNNPDKVRFHRTRHAALRAEQLSDLYICHDIFKARLSEVPKEVIELKRQHILLVREMKKLKEVLKNGTD